MLPGEFDEPNKPQDALTPATTLAQFHRAIKIIPARPRLRIHRHAPCDRQDIPCKGVGIGIGRECAVGFEGLKPLP